MITSPESCYDVIVAGGGMAGATLACALGNSALRVAVIEAHAAPAAWPLDSRDLRVSAITLGSMRIFETLGVWQRMVAERVSPFREMHVWDANSPGAIHFDSADVGADTLGYIVENRVIQMALYARCQEFSNIEWLNSTRITAIDRCNEYISVHTEDNQQLRARLLVGADGPDSLIRELAGITTHGRDYRQTAIVASVKTTRSHRQTAWQRFLPDGPLAFLPLTDNYTSIVWSLPPERAAHLLSLDDTHFRAELQNALGLQQDLADPDKGLGGIESVGPRAAFPLRLIHADQYVQARLALIGDAAHTLHPMAGQGVNLGLADAAVLAQLLSEAAAKKTDVGAVSTLRRYERWRKGDNMAMVAALETLKQLFSSPYAPVRQLRHWGLRVTNATTPLKNLIMRRAMGITGDLPRLARGLALNSRDDRKTWLDSNH
ncbi:MAG: UbiH/UbiF/VisC/COQ6 family ubiquinone biosynthesis hydroxylase [Gammaproteobacteria bacterium]